MWNSCKINKASTPTCAMTSSLTDILSVSAMPTMLQSFSPLINHRYLKIKNWRYHYSWNACEWGGLNMCQSNDKDATPSGFQNKSGSLSLLHCKSVMQMKNGGMRIFCWRQLFSSAPPWPLCKCCLSCLELSGWPLNSHTSAHSFRQVN